MTLFKNIEDGKYFIYRGVVFEKVLQSQDVFGPYNALSRTAAVGSKVRFFDSDTVVEKVGNDTPNT